MLPAIWVSGIRSPPPKKKMACTFSTTAKLETTTMKVAEPFVLTQISVHNKSWTTDESSSSSSSGSRWRRPWKVEMHLPPPGLASRSSSVRLSASSAPGAARAPRVSASACSLCFLALCSTFLPCPAFRRFSVSADAFS